MPYLIKPFLFSSIIIINLVTAAYSQDSDFSFWLNELSKEAVSEGVSEETVSIALNNIEPIDRILELDRNQPEFKLDFWDYVNRVVSQDRIDQGRLRMMENKTLLEDIYSRYGIAPHILVAAWGIESNYGITQGSNSVIGSLVTLAYDPRRSRFFRTELINSLRIIDEGHISLESMKGSWAGAMGQVQFMPSTFISYAKDGDGDGKKDIWSNKVDALESAANFMSSQGWDRGIIWGRQVILPPEFDKNLIGLALTKTVEEWGSLGILTIDKRELSKSDIKGSVISPGEQNDPHFLVYDNYRDIMRWNRSHFFAISLGHLSDRIIGLPELVK